MRIPLLALLSCLLLGGASAAEVVTVDIDDADNPFGASRGYLARPAGPVATARPAVLVVHEWYGLNDYAKRRARELAEAGYVALACDLYGGGRTTTDRAQAGAWAAELKNDRALMRGRAKRALEVLRQQPGVDPARLAAMGFCFGGTVSLELARSGEPLAAAISFHGGLSTTMPAAPGAVRAKVLVLHGGSDPAVPPAELAAFIGEMVAAKADWRMEVYGRAVHAFTNVLAGNDPSKPAAYDAEAERRSFAALHALLGEVFATPAAAP